MPPLLTCPDTPELQALVRGDLGADDQAELTAHLDTCARCQDRLERLAAGSAQWALRTPRGTDTPSPSPDSAFWPALRAVEREVAFSGEETSTESRVEEEISLAFLAPPEVPGTLGKLDHFHVERVIGRGGMGVVLRALDSCLERRVAIKLLDPQLADNETAQRRFCREARAAAAVTHDHVVAMHYVEEFKGLPYLVMQHVDGESLQDRLDRSGPLSALDVARIGTQTAAGLAAAHGRGLIHRDIKPANILLEKVLDRVKITDFGLARAVEDVKLTQSGFVAGTPLYMAPEQARGEPLDARTDLFSLGSVLYACCTGRAPFAGSTPFLVLRQVTEGSPTPIHSINPDLPEELVAVVDRLMSKRPDDRFQTAEEVAGLLSEIQARLQAAAPESPSARLARTGARLSTPPYRKRGLLAAAMVIPAFLAGLAAGYAVGRRIPSVASGDTADASPRARAVLDGNAGPVWSVAFSPDGQTLAMAIDNGTVKLWDPETGSVRRTLSGHRGPVWSVVFSPDGQTLATGCDDGTARLWDLASGEERRSFQQTGGVRAVAFGPRSKTLVSGGRDGSVRVWDLTTGRERSAAPEGHTHSVTAVAVTPDGKAIASASGDRTVRLWDATTGQARVSFDGRDGHRGAVYTMALSPDGRFVASAGWRDGVRVWDAASGSFRTVLGADEPQDYWSVAFSTGGRLIAAAGEDRCIRVWDAVTGSERAHFRGLAAAVYAVAFSPDGKTLAAGVRDGTIQLLDAPGH